MATSNRSTGQPLSDPMLFVEATPVSHSAQQDTDEAQTTLDTCSLGYLKPLADYDPDTQSWKMFGDISLWEESRLLEVLPPSGMTASGNLYQLPRRVRRTLENESLLWPTPTAVTRPMEGNVRMYRAQVEAGKMTEAEANAILGKSVWEAQGKLPALFPTPQARDHKGASGRSMKGLEKDLPFVIGGSPNPEWVEWLMGFPIGWTDLED